MARNTFQGRMRTYAGRSKSGINLETGIPMQLLPQNLAGPIQLVVQNPEDGDHMMGMLPAYWVVQSVVVITPASAGIFGITLPSYKDLVGVAAVSGADATVAGAAVTIDNGGYSSFALDRPLILNTTGVTDLMRVGIFGFPLDDATEQEN